MRIAHILPVNVQNKVPRRSMQFYLAHLIEKYPDVYRELAESGKGANEFRILDNGCYELKKPVDLSVLYGAAQAINADEVVVPDALFDSKTTIEMAQEYLPIMSMWPCQRMVVAQGKSWGEVRDCALQLERMRWVDTVGLPKYVSYPDFEGNLYGVKGRLIMSWSLRKTMDTKIHFLGSGVGTAELIGSNVSHIRSMDSSLWMMFCERHMLPWAARPAGMEAVLEDNETLKPHLIEDYIRILDHYLSRSVINLGGW